MNAVTSNSSDDRTLSLKELCDTVLRLKHQPALKAIKISRATVLMFPLSPVANNMSRLYGVPVEIDDSLRLFESIPVY